MMNSIFKKLSSVFIPAIMLASLLTIMMPIPVSASTLNIKVGASNDDCWYRSDALAWSLTNGEGVIGSNGADENQFAIGLRFNNVTVPAGSEITAAYLTVVAKNTLSGTGVKSYISAELEINPSAFADSYSAFESRIADNTSATVAWDDIASWTVNTSYNSPSIVSVIEEVIAQDGWSSGNSVVIFIDDLAGRTAETANHYRTIYSYDGSSTYAATLHIEYTPAPVVTNSTGASNITTTAARLNGELTSDGGSSTNVTVYYGDNDGATTAGNWDSNYDLGIKSVGSFYYDISSLTAGTTYYYRYYAVNSAGGAWASSTASYITLPDAPTNVLATDGTYSDKVVVTWTKSTGATGYKVYEGANLLDTLGDVATYDDTTAPAGAITAGTATASEGTSTAYVTLTLTGATANAGAARTYKVIAVNATGDSADSNTDTGYRGSGAGALTYQWYVSAADSDASFSSLGAGATTNPYNDTTAPAGTLSITTLPFAGYGADWIILKGYITAGGSASGRYYYCEVSATGVASADSTHDRGYKAAGGVSEVGFDYGLTTAYGTEWTNVVALVNGDTFTGTIRGLTAGTVYHFRAKGYNGSWVYGSDNYVNTTGSPVVYEYLNTGGDADSTAIYGSEILAQQFTVGATSHTTVYIRLYIARVGAPGDVLVELKHANTSHEPTGIAIASGILNGNVFSTSYFWLQFDLDEVSLIAGEEYAIVVSAPDGDVSNYVTIKQDTGGSLANAVGLHSSDSGNTWTSDSPIDYLFEVWGNAAARIISASAHTSYIETGDIVFMLEYLNIYPPYYGDATNPQQDVKQYFTIRLLDIDGTTVLAATPMLQWGDMPASIYLNAAQASSITLGGAYYLEIYGLFGSNPSSMYQLVATDWNGSVGGWVLSTAHNMALYYGTAMTTFIANTGEVLNDEANAMFTTGIPYLMDLYPELFATINKTPGFIVPTTMPVSVDTWQNIVGIGAASLFNDIGTMLGMSGKHVGAVLIAIIYLFLANAVSHRGGSPVIGLAISFPIVAIGIFCLLVDYVVIGAIMSVLAALVLVGMWITRT